MKLKEKISLEKIFEKEYKIKLVEHENNKEEVINNFFHNNKNRGKANDKKQGNAPTNEPRKPIIITKNGDKK